MKYNNNKKSDGTEQIRENSFILQRKMKSQHHGLAGKAAIRIANIPLLIGIPAALLPIQVPPIGLGRATERKWPRLGVIA